MSEQTISKPETHHLTTPPAQLRLKDASQCTPPLPRLLGWAAAQLYRGIHARCAFSDHPIRRADGDGKQDRENSWQGKKALTCPQFENGDGERQAGVSNVILRLRIQGKAANSRTHAALQAEAMQERRSHWPGEQGKRRIC